MIQKISMGVALGLCLVISQLAASARDLKVIANKIITGFGHIESVGDE